jgi:hypothetical protein
MQTAVGYPVVKITFKVFGPHLASSRYRAVIPMRELAKLGVGDGQDWLIIGKHGWDWDKETKGYKKVCFDVCDDHFDNVYSYTENCKRADLVTCNSLEMARVIKERTGVTATFIPDPYEQPQKEPRIHDRILWFGHASNIGDLVPWCDLPNLEVVSNIEGVTQWSPENMDQAFDRAGLVIIPTGKSMAKSGNRAIESIRRGLFVVAGYLPAYSDLGIYIGNIGDGVNWALSHQDEVIGRIRRSQAYIRDEYSPERIGKQWLKALEST